MCIVSIKKSKSIDGLNWVKDNNIELDIDLKSNWDNIMVCYPYLVKRDNEFLMFYNGNGFGKTGIGYAINDSIE